MVLKYTCAHMLGQCDALLIYEIILQLLLFSLTVCQSFGVVRNVLSQVCVACEVGVNSAGLLHQEALLLAK